jgi:hypothetical protein
MLATGYPFAWTAAFEDARRPRFDAVDHVPGTPGLSDDGKSPSLEAMRPRC